MVIITNKGLIDPLAFELIGASTKRSDNSTIGFFGSGVKYAIAGLLKRGIPFQVWRGNEAIDFSTERVEMRGMAFDRILINGKPTSMTTDMGPKWETWMLIRELYANAVDEGGEMAVTDEYQQFIKEDSTTIIFPDRSSIEDIIKRQDFYFTRGRDVIYEDKRIRVYEDIGEAGYYVKGIYVGGGSTGHGYEVRDIPYEINEERVIMHRWAAQSNTFERIMGITDARTVKRIVARTKSKTIEGSIFLNTLPYTFSSVVPSPAWADIMFFDTSDSDYATEWNHVVVSKEIYDRLAHPNKWTKRRWDPSGTNEQNNKLAKALELVRAHVPTICDGHRIAFAKSQSRALGIGTEDGVVYVHDSIADEPVETIASHLVMMLSDSKPEVGIKCLTDLFKQQTNNH